MNSTISLAIIVKNAEATFERCLSTFSQVANEVIVVDTGSTDKTLEIAEKYNCKIYHFEWIDDFSAARNYCFEQCTRDYIFWVDSDDYILPEDVEKVKNLDFTGKEIIICNYEYAHDEFGKSCLTVPRERIIKRTLFNEGKVVWEDPIHEFLTLGGALHISNISTHHNKQQGTSERNLALLERVVQKKDSSRNIYYLAKEYFDAGRIDDSIYYLNMFVHRDDGFWEDKYAAYYKLAQCYLSKGDDKQFLDNIWESIKMEDRRAEPFYELASYWMGKGNYDKAIQWYETCLNRRRPKDLLASYQPEYHTWLPCLSLCLCYNSIGDVKKAHEYNRRIFEYRPQDSRAINNDNILSKALGIPTWSARVEKKPTEVSTKVHKDGEGKKLNLGCGGKILPGYVNVDLFSGSGVDEVFDLDDIPYKDGTIAGINSEHSLEHVGWVRVNRALQEWYRVLKPGGELLLKIPDLEECCKGYLNSDGKGAINGIPDKQWFKFTLFGIQTSQAGEPDDAQVHKSGFSKEEIRGLLEKVGFVVDYLENYPLNYGTPSIGLRALKPVSDVKVGWIAPMNWDAAQTRIRVLNVDRWLRSRGYRSKVVSYQDILSQDYDIVIVGKSFDEGSYTEVQQLKKAGKTVYCDLCEEITQFPWVKEILGICDKVICCSEKLAEIISKINPNVIVIEDSWEA